MISTIAFALFGLIGVVNLAVIGAMIVLLRRFSALEEDVRLHLEGFNSSLRRIDFDSQSGSDDIGTSLSEAWDRISAIDGRVEKLERARSANQPSSSTGLLPSSPASPARAAPSPDGIDSVLQEFCSDRIDHNALIKGAVARGLRWGSGTTVRGQNCIRVEFSSDENRILVVETVRGGPQYYILVREDAHWSLDLAFVFKRADADERTAGGREARVRTRKPGRGTLRTAGELAIDEPGLVELFPS